MPIHRLLMNRCGGFNLRVDGLNAGGGCQKLKVRSGNSERNQIPAVLERKLGSMNILLAGAPIVETGEAQVFVEICPRIEVIKGTYDAWEMETGNRDRDAQALRPRD